MIIMISSYYIEYHSSEKLFLLRVIQFHFTHNAKCLLV